MIAERTRDKMSAARKKGKWVGGRPTLGYDVDPNGRRLVVNEREAAQVREAFELSVQERSLFQVVDILNGRGDLMKSWVTKKGTTRKGNKWDKSSLRRMLTNVIYLGKVNYKGDIYQGEHAPVIDARAFEKVQELLANAPATRDRASVTRNKQGFLLRGLVKCAACGSVMTSSFAHAHGKTYRYYKCTLTNRRGAAACEVRSVPADEFERYIVQRIREMSRNPTLVRTTAERVHADRERAIPALTVENERLSGEPGCCRKDTKRVLTALADQEGGDGRFATEHLGELDTRAAEIERRMAEISKQVVNIRRATIKPEDIDTVMTLFDPVWDALVPKERARVLHLLIEQVEYDGPSGRVSITFHPAGVTLLPEDATKSRTKEVTAWARSSPTSRTSTRLNRSATGSPSISRFTWRSHRGACLCGRAPRRFHPCPVGGSRAWPGCWSRRTCSSECWRMGKRATWRASRGSSRSTARG
ncbi:MAG: recombinase zinc beta ribbon domain-containing protein [Deltaproteobacteria bacterium]|nr:recombinase zinc beta ribbon domain-containing protein [Deltaproteobacteria bacterium]